MRLRFRLLAAFLLLALLAALLVLAVRRFAPRRSTLYVGGPVLTMDARNRVSDALLVVGQRIVAVGEEARSRARSLSGVRVVDLGGRALLPGFVDAHSHFPGEGLFEVHANLRGPPWGTVDSIAAVVERLRKTASGREPGRWVFGFGYDDTVLRERRHPTRHELDRVSMDHPVAAVHISGHLVAVNSRALEELGIGAGTRDPPGGRIRRDPATGEPTGVLEERAAAAVMERAADMSFTDALRVTRAASRAYLRHGFTCVQNGLALARQVRAMPWFSRLGLLPLRLVLWPAAEVVGATPARSFSPRPRAGEWFRVGAVKLVADGSIQGYTAYLTRPYFVAPPGQPGFRGYPRMPARELRERVRTLHRGGWQIAIHANGDAAIDEVLDAFEAAQREAPRTDARHIVLHALAARDDQLDRMRRLGVLPSFFAVHPYAWGDRHRDIFLGPERAARVSPAGSAAARGLRFALHVDSPVVPPDPLLLVWAAVNRTTTSGRVLGAGERLSPMRALRAVTIDAAYQLFLDGVLGSLEPGKRADLVILSASPLGAPAAIRDIRVLETIVAGKTLYRAARSRPPRGTPRSFARPAQGSVRQAGQPGNPNG